MFMKNFAVILTISLFTVFFGCSRSGGKSTASSGGVQDSTVIVFAKTMNDFGDLKSGESVVCSFSFINEGKKPLLIHNVTAGCGCTNVKYPLKPVPPGKGGSVEVTFNTKGRQGHQRQAITVYSNGSKEPIMLVFHANVQ